MTGDGVTARQEWRSHWGLVLAAMLGTSFIAVPTVVLGQFIPPLQEHFGWSRAEISLGLTLLALVGTPLAPFAGALADRFGSRSVAVPGLLLSSLAYAAFGLVSSLWFWLAAWTTFALFSLLIRSMIWNRAASNAFSANRGLALAVIMSGSSVGQIAGPVVAQWLIGDVGWQLAFAGLGLGWGGIALLATLLLFHEPRRTASTAGTTTAAAAPAELPGLTVQQAVRDTRILRIAFAILVSSTMAAGFLVHLFPLLTGTGMEPAAAAKLVAMLGIAALAGQFATGWLADRWRSGLLPLLCFLIPTAGYLLTLQAAEPGPSLWLGVLLVGYGSSATMNITVYLTTLYAGLRHFGKIFGLISSCLGLGGGTGALIAGGTFDATGSYDAFLILAAAAMGLAALAHVALAPNPRFAT